MIKIMKYMPFQNPPMSAIEIEVEGLRHTMKGPGGIGPRGWASVQDLWRLKEDFGQNVSCRSLVWLAEAAHARVLLTDPACRSFCFHCVELLTV